MKNILFVNDNFLVGGTNTSALTQINLLISLGYSVTLWIVSGIYNKEMIENLPSEVNIIYGAEVDLQYKVTMQFGRFKRFLKHPKKMFDRFKNITLNNKSKNIEQKRIKGIKLNDFYETVFYFDVPLVTSYLKWIKRYVKARKSVLWIHTVYDNETIMENFILKEELSYSILNKFDKVFAVSEECKKGFIKSFNSKKIDVDVVRLPIDIKKIKSMALKEPSDIHKKGITIVTVGRLAKEKGIDRALNTCKILVSEGFEISWYIIGDGEDEGKITKMVFENGLEKFFVLLGRKSNPYQYILSSDIVVVPSRTESWGLVTNEALILNKPIVATNVGGAYELLADYRKGFIVDNSQEAITNGVRTMINTLSKFDKDKDIDWEDVYEVYGKGYMDEIIKKVKDT